MDLIMKKKKLSPFWRYVKKCAKRVRKNPHLRHMDLSDPWREGHRDMDWRPDHEL
jgi:hypothetical protein